jgi:hypothetical protein
MTSPPLLVTSAAIPTAPFVEISEPTARMRLTVESIRNWLVAFPNLGIVLCDGSGFDFTDALQEASVIDSERLEVLCFTNDQEKVKRQGKGYGEGEIVSYALRHSQLLRRAKVFAKCTGKLFVENYQPCTRGTVHSIRIEKSYKGRFSRAYDACDTRFYVVSAAYYRSVLEHCHQGVDDRRGYFLEHAFADALKKSGARGTDFAFKPQISGHSGSMACEYRPLSESIKSKVLRNIRRWLT